MPIHHDFQKIHDSMIQQYGEQKGEEVYHAWLNEHGCDDTISMEANHKKGQCQVSSHVRSQFPFFPFILSERVATTTKPLKITGIAAKTGLSRNQVYYSKDSLTEIGKKLVGAPIYVEHVSAFSSVGKVTKTWVDNHDDILYYMAEIFEDEAIAKIRNGLIRHVSIAADYENLEIVNGILPSGFSNAELSLVAVAGIPETNLEIMESLRKVTGSEEEETDEEKENGIEKFEKQLNFYLNDHEKRLRRIEQTLGLYTVSDAEKERIRKLVGAP